MLARGNTVDTDFDRFIPILMSNSVKLDVDGNEVPNDIQTYAGDSYFEAYFGADQGGTFDATVIRLREVSLAYVLPKTWI